MLTPEWSEALHARREILEAEINERRAELAQINRVLLRAALAPRAEERRREWERRRARRNPPHPALAHEARRDEEDAA